VKQNRKIIIVDHLALESGPGLRTRRDCRRKLVLGFRLHTRQGPGSLCWGVELGTSSSTAELSSFSRRDNTTHQ
jgi:hypothetical protein